MKVLIALVLAISAVSSFSVGEIKDENPAAAESFDDQKLQNVFDIINQQLREKRQVSCKRNFSPNFSDFFRIFSLFSI